MRTRVKICGITRPVDALSAAEAGADAVGLVFAEGSPRCVSLDQARAICAALPPFVTVVGLFVDAPAERIRAVLGQIPLALLQFHGRETPEQCRVYGRPYIKVIHMRPPGEPMDGRGRALSGTDADEPMDGRGRALSGTDAEDADVDPKIQAQAKMYGDAAGFLLDTYSPAAAGGTGQVFDWSRVPRALGRPLILAGGLTPENVTAAIKQVRPYAVDVSSGVEQSKGIKDAAKIAAFLRSVYR